MEIVLKFILLVFVGLSAFSFKTVFSDFKKISKSEDWEETTIFGRLIISTVLTLTLLGLSIIVLTLLFVIGSKVTIESYF